MNDAGQARRLTANALHQASHVIGIAGSDAETRCIALSELSAVRHLEHGVSALSQLKGKLRSDAHAACSGSVGEQ